VQPPDVPGPPATLVTQDREPFQPIWCGDTELSAIAPEDLLLSADSGYGRARVLVRLHGEPLGYASMDVSGDGLSGDDVRAAILPELLARLEDHLSQEGLTAGPLRLPVAAASSGCPMVVDEGEEVTVIVCTRDRPETLRSCLHHLRRLTYDPLNVLIVDNAPSDDRSERVFNDIVGDDDRFSYVVEERPGLSRARNRGWTHATSSIVAYTDDDVSVDPDWVQGIVRGFRRRHDVGCVSGLVCTASIEGPAEAYFDGRVSWSKNCAPRLYDMAGQRTPDRLYPYSPGIFGTGANFAFRRELLVTMGGFDEALGAGTRTAGGEDLDAFVLTLKTGAALAYEPSAIVWHHHRADNDALTKQMYAYGTGFGAFLAKHLIDRRTRGDVVRRLLVGSVKLFRVPGATRASVPDAASMPPGLLRRELRGMLAGPLLYLRARRNLRSA